MSGTSFAKLSQFAGNAVGIVRGRSAKTDTRVAGLKELAEALFELNDPKEKARRGLRALNAAGRVVKAAAQEKAPVIDSDDPAVAAGIRKPGTVKNAIRVSKSKYTKGEWLEVIIRVKRLSKERIKKFKGVTGKAGAMNPDDPFYWWWIEFGTSKMGARPFMRPAFEGTKEEQLMKIKKSLGTSIKQWANKARSKVNNASRKR